MLYKEDGKRPEEKPGYMQRVKSSSVSRGGRPKNFPECIAVYGEKILKGCPPRQTELPGTFRGKGNKKRVNFAQNRANFAGVIN